MHVGGVLAPQSFMEHPSELHKKVLGLVLGLHRDRGCESSQLTIRGARIGSSAETRHGRPVAGSCLAQ